MPSVSSATRGDEPLHPVHRVAVVGVGLVPLEHRELGVVLERDALVAEVLADLVDALETADDQALEVELGRDPKVERLVEFVVVRLERPGERAAVSRLQDRRLDLDEALVVERAANGRDHPGAEHEVGACVLVHQQVEVAPPVTLLDVGQPVEGVGERRADLAEHLEGVDRQRRLAATRLRRMAGHADDVAEVNVDLARAVRRAEELDPARAVDQVEEGQLPHVATCKHTARQPPLVRRPRCPGSRSSASARTAAISSRSGKRFGVTDQA